MLYTEQVVLFLLPPPAMTSSFYTLPFPKLTHFIQAILDQNLSLIAPVKTDLTRFQKISDPRQIDLKNQPLFSVKEYFFRTEETIFEYTKQKIKNPQLKSLTRIFFGLRRCDLNAVAHQDLVFMTGEKKDPYYTAHRAKSVLIGYHCSTPPNKYCFCGSLDLKDFYDLMFFKQNQQYLIHVQTPLGHDFIKPFLPLLAKTEYQLTDQDRQIPGTNKLKNLDLASLYNHPDWAKAVVKCLSCGACTTLCPTCYCHELHDQPSLSAPSSGKRVRHWSSCQLKSFTRVAGNHIFRQNRIERFKHRIYHQLQYFKEKNGVNLCVGCGRCISGCPTRIDFVSLINSMPKNK